MAESFFASLECEFLDRRTFRTQVEARMEVFRYIEGWYNPRRRHSALGYLSPLNFEAQHDASSPALARELKAWTGGCFRRGSLGVLLRCCAAEAFDTHLF